jgi:hypothetical protein
MHTELQEKKKRLATMNNHKFIEPAVATTSARTSKINIQSDQDKKREEEDIKKERRVIKMVILNGFFNFFLRAPDILFWMEYQGVWSIFDNGGLTLLAPGFLSFIVDISLLTYILTFSTNFLIFYLYNKNFKEAVMFF